MVIAGLIIEASRTPALTRDFLAFKRRFFPGRFTCGPALDHVLTEIKGNEILQMTRSAARNKRRQADLIRSELLGLVETYGCRLVGRVWVKEPGKSLKPDSTYCYAVQDIALHFSQYLLVNGAHGLLIADGRSQSLNVPVAHSVFTQKWRAGGDPYPPRSSFRWQRTHTGHRPPQRMAVTITATFEPTAANVCVTCSTDTGTRPAAGVAASWSRTRAVNGPDRCCSANARRTARSGRPASRSAPPPAGRCRATPCRSRGVLRGRCPGMC